MFHKFRTLAIAAVIAMVIAAASPAAAIEWQDGQGKPLPYGSPVPELTDQAAAPNDGAFKEIKWDDLIPADWDIRKLLENMRLDDLSDNDPRANKAMAKIMDLFNQAPANAAMDGKPIRLPGFVSPIEGDEKSVTEFLLVPYFGACIHVPPPPANQIVHVLPATPVPSGMTMFPVWVSGVLKVERLDSRLAHSGYRMQGAKVEPYGGR